MQPVLHRRGAEVRGLEFLSIQPGEVDLRLTTDDHRPRVEQPTAEGEVQFVVRLLGVEGVLVAGEEIADVDFLATFLDQLPVEGDLGGFSKFDVPAGEVAVPATGYADEKALIADDDSACDELDVLGHRGRIVIFLSLRKFGVVFLESLCYAQNCSTQNKEHIWTQSRVGWAKGFPG